MRLQCARSAIARTPPLSIARQLPTSPMVVFAVWVEHALDVTVQGYEDAGISGAKGRDQRPGLDAMMKAVNAKEFDMIAACRWIDSADRSPTCSAYSRASMKRASVCSFTILGRSTAALKAARSRRTLAARLRVISVGTPRSPPRRLRPPDRCLATPDSRANSPIVSPTP
jgi:hypothetical protein